MKNILSYFFGAILATFITGKQDYVFSISQPPILGGLLGVCGKWTKKAKFIYNIQDFNPEQVQAVNFSSNSFVTSIMLILDKFSCKQSSLVITVGRDLIETLSSRFRNREIPKSVLINNWIDEKMIYPLQSDHKGVLEFKEKYGLSDKFVFMYSGNIGLYYDLDNIIKVIRKLKRIKTPDGREVEFVFVGAGSMLENLISYKIEHNLDNVSFIPYQDKKDFIFSLNSADIHWCVNALGIKGVSCPSKYYGIAACAKPVLAVLESGSEVEKIIQETQGGLCSEPGDYKTVEQNIKWFIKHSDDQEVINMGNRSYTNLHQNLTRDASVKKYKESILAI